MTSDDIGLTFVGRLARDNGWKPGYAERVYREYLRFVFLAATAGHPVTPSVDVDEVWHLHLCYTRSYWTTCAAPSSASRCITARPRVEAGRINVSGSSISARLNPTAGTSEMNRPLTSGRMRT